MIWIDALTPKQLLWATRLDSKLRSAGFETLLTVRRYRELSWLVRELSITHAISIGRHGGGTLEGKLRASLSRSGALLKLLEKGRPALSFSFGSPEASRVSFGLGVPHFMQCDAPHSEAVARLTVPLTDKLFTPWFIPSSAWTCYGISARRIVKYRALDPIVWLRDVIEEPPEPYAGVNPSKTTVLVRTEETKAAYLLGRVKRPLSLTWLPRLAKMHPDVKFVVIPRYADQRKLLAEEFRKAGVGNVYVLSRPVIGYKLIKASSVFVGYGGTMTAEAVLLGVPSLACFPGTLTYTDKFLVRRGLVIRPKDLSDPTDELEAILSHLEEARRQLRAKIKRLLSTFEDPNEVIAKEIFEHLG